MFKDWTGIVYPVSSGPSLLSCKTSLYGAFKYVIAVALLLSAMAVGATANPKYAGIVIDAKTGKTLYANSADSLRYPASLTKMMTLYMVFEALDNGSLSKKPAYPFPETQPMSNRPKSDFARGRQSPLSRAYMLW